MVEMGTGQKDVCTPRIVAVGNKQAAWIFAEFQTDRTVTQLSAWLEPTDWPQWGGKLFESMTPVGERTTAKDSDGDRWHGKYLEAVNIGGRKLHTVLQCDGKQTSKWAAMTYDLDHSVVDVLTVDRGFLCALDLGKRRLVKALKIVGFTDPVDNALATAVCPEWTEWMKEATKTAAEQLEGSPVGETHGALGDAGADDASATEAAAGFTRGYAQQWADCMSGMTDFYGNYATDVGNRLWSGQYGPKDAAEDSSRLFLRLARDWSRVWRAGNVVAEGLAGADVPPSGGVPSGGGAWKRSLEYSTVFVPAPSTTVTVEVSDLSRVAKKQATIRSKAIKVDPARIDGRPGNGGSEPVSVRLLTDTTALPPGLYEGELTLRSKDGHDTTAPALFYASGARPTPKEG